MSFEKTLIDWLISLGISQIIDSVARLIIKQYITLPLFLRIPIISLRKNKKASRAQFHKYTEETAVFDYWKLFGIWLVLSGIALEQAAADSEEILAVPALRTSFWYDSQGRTIKTLQPGGLVTKTQYDGAGRVVKVFSTDGGGDPAPGSAGNRGHAGGQHQHHDGGQDLVEPEHCDQRHARRTDGSDLVHAQRGGGRGPRALHRGHLHAPPGVVPRHGDLRVCHHHPDPRRQAVRRHHRRVGRHDQAHRRQLPQPGLHAPVEHHGALGDNPMGIHWTGIVLGLGWVM
jgi:YD repeat-containing protein